MVASSARADWADHDRRAGAVDRTVRDLSAGGAIGSSSRPSDRSSAAIPARPRRSPTPRWRRSTRPSARPVATSRTRRDSSRRYARPTSRGQGQGRRSDRARRDRDDPQRRPVPRPRPGRLHEETAPRHAERLLRKVRAGVRICPEDLSGKHDQGDGAGRPTRYQSTLRVAYIRSARTRNSPREPTSKA